METPKKIDWDKIAKLITWFVIVALSGIIAVAFFNVILP